MVGEPSDRGATGDPGPDRGPPADAPQFVYDPGDGAMVDVDDSLCALHGLSREELLARPLDDLYGIDAAAVTAAERRRARERGRIERPDGEVIPVEVSVWNARGVSVGTVHRVDEAADPSPSLEGRVRALHHAATDIVAATDVETAYETAVETAETVLEFDVCAIFTAEDGRLELAAASEDEYVTTRTQRIDEGVAGATYREHRSILVEDAAGNPVARPASEAFASAVSVPVGDEAVFQAISTTEGYYDRADLELAELLAVHVAEAVDRIESERSVEATKEKVARLHAIATELETLTDRQEVFERTIAAGEEILGFDYCSIHVVDEGEFVAAAVSEAAPVEVGDRTLSVEEGIAGEAYRTGESNVMGAPWERESAEPIADSIVSGLTVPISDLGVFQAVSNDFQAFDETDLELAELLAANVAETCERLDAQRELRERQRELQRLVENLPGMVYRTRAGPESPFAFVSDGATELTGFGPADLAGDGVGYFHRIHPDDRESALRQRRLAVERGDPFEVTYRLATADENWRWVQEQGSGVYDEDGELLFVEGFVSDITESKRREQLRVLNRVLRHNVRNEVNLLSVHADFLSNEVEDPALGRSTSAIADAADRMRRIGEKARTLQELLEYDPVAERTAVDVAEVARRVVDHARTSFPEAEVECLVDGPAVAHAVPEVRTAVEELVENAIIHDDGDPSVQVRVEGRDDAVAIVVTDDGPGIPREELEALQSKAETPLEHGSGLGLWLANWVVEDSRGTLSFDRDGGTVATVTVPAADVGGE